MRGWVKFLLVASALVVLFWPEIKRHWELVNDRYFVPYDAVQYVPAFFKFDPIDPVPTTYAKEYYLEVICPPFYKWLTALGAQWVDVRRFQLVMMYMAYLAFIVVIGRLGWVLGGAELCFAVVALTIIAWIFMGLGFIGGAPRMYAYPLIALMLYSLILDRPYLLAVAVVAAALVYPVVALIGGTCLAGWLLLPLCFHQGVVATWRLRRRLLVLCATGSLTVVLILPLVFGGGAYGRRVVVADIPAYPEAGADGNYRPFDRLPYKIFNEELLTYFIGPFYSHGDAILPWGNIHQRFSPDVVLLVFLVTGLAVIFVIVRGMKLLVRDDLQGGGVRVIGFFAVCVILHVIAWLATPYLYMPTRYFMFSLPFLVTLLFPWSLFVLLGRVSLFQSSPHLSRAAFLGIIALYLIAFGSRGNVEIPDAFVDKPARPLFEAISKLPPNALVAGWPLGVIRKMEYATRRNGFLIGDLHQVLHLTFMQVMRERMDAMFDAYLSTDVRPLHRLRHQFGVTHLMVEVSHFTDPQRPPEYFSPWRARIAPRLAEIKGKEYLLNEELHRRAAVYRWDGLILLDLAKLP